MRRTLLTLFAAFALACSSSSIPEGIEAPLVRVRQPSGQIADGGVGMDPIRIGLVIDLMNRSDQILHLRYLSLQSVAGGAFHFGSTARVLSERFEPGETRSVDIWVHAVSDHPSSDLSNAVSVRGSALFESDLGKFRHVFIEQIDIVR
ncbi:MAG TPA: hypothetical protein VM557_06885 [Thermoanaerobaculia bacterium]|nr:hypothetical protein [Thermoanaerobaculia bacterium]